ncbi:MAG: pantoate--beta-alanine ligase, partial [Gammaproteobacteria bacterium]
GHLSLLRRASELADKTIVSIFVNPIQFGKGEDYEKYPSTLEADREKLAEYSLDLLFTPDLSQLYPGGTDIDCRINVPELTDILCGQFRPGHFSGVATVVAKLFINAQPDYALFGEKDYQQLLVIRRVVHDLCIPVEVIAMPTVRESDGLAISSRNVYLNAEQRQQAPCIYQMLNELAAKLQAGATDIAALEQQGMTLLEQAGLRPEYVGIRRSGDLGRVETGDTHLSILTAAWLGEARLIDNVKVVID